MNNTESEQIEIEIEEMKAHQAKRDTVYKFMNTAIFKEVIEEGYFKEEAARLCMVKCEYLEPVLEKKIDNMMLGIGGLFNYLQTILQRGAQMDNAIESAYKARQDIIDEEANS